MTCECGTQGAKLRVFSSNTAVRAAYLCEGCYQQGVGPAEMGAVTYLAISDLVNIIKMLECRMPVIE